MRVTSFARLISGVAALGLMSTVVASAGVVRGGTIGQHVSVRPATQMLHGIPNTSCPSEFTGGCFAITASSPFEAEWCVSSTGDCSSGLTGPVTWTADAFKAKSGKATKAIGAVWSPNPGNPSTITVTTKKTKSKPKVKYGVALSGCYTGGCFTDFVVYGFSV
jgi:hypothetical protein